MAAAAVLAAGFVFRLGLAAWLPPGLDEAYAVAVARGFDIAFFDHPPLGFWAGVAIPALTGWEDGLAYRLPAVLLGTLTGVAVWRLGVMLAGPVAGLWAAALYALAPHMVVGAGLMVLPDAPLDAALAWLAVALARLAQAPAPPPVRAWVWPGLLLAAAMASKLTALLVPPAVLLWLGFGRRAWLATPGPWIGAAVGFAGLVPTLVWNARHGWAMAAFHGARTGQAFDPANLALMTLGQAVYLLPPVMALCILGTVRAARAGADEGERLLAWLAAVPVAAFSVIYLFGRYTFPHWPMPGWLLALPLAGAWATAVGTAARRRAAAWVAAFAMPVWALAVAAAVHLPTGLLTRGMDPPPAWDATVEAFDWRAAVPALAAEGWLDAVQALAAPGWIDAGLMATAFGGRLPMLVPGGPVNAHHFAFLPAADLRLPTLMLSPGPLAEAQARLDGARAMALAWGARVTREGIVVLDRGGRPHAAVAALRLDWPDTQP